MSQNQDVLFPTANHPHLFSAMGYLENVKCRMQNAELLFR